MSHLFLRTQISFVITTAIISFSLFFINLDIVKHGFAVFPWLLWLRSWGIVYLLLFVSSRVIPAFVTQIFRKFGGK